MILLKLFKFDAFSTTQDTNPLMKMENDSYI